MPSRKFKTGDLVRFKKPKSKKLYAKKSNPGWADAMKPYIGRMGKVVNLWVEAEVVGAPPANWFRIMFEDRRVWIIYKGDLELVTDPLWIFKYGSFFGSAG